MSKSVFSALFFRVYRVYTGVYRGIRRGVYRGVQGCIYRVYTGVYRGLQAHSQGIQEKERTLSLPASQYTAGKGEDPFPALEENQQEKERTLFLLI